MPQSFGATCGSSRPRGQMYREKWEKEASCAAEENSGRTPEAHEGERSRCDRLLAHNFRVIATRDSRRGNVPRAVFPLTRDITSYFTRKSHRTLTFHRYSRALSLYEAMIPPVRAHRHVRSSEHFSFVSFISLSLSIPRCTGGISRLMD